MLDNAGFLQFYKLTIEALNSTYGQIISISNNLDDVTFRNCHFDGINTSNTSTRLALVFRSYNSPTNRTENLHFLNTRFSNGSYGAYLSNAYSNYANGMVIKNCTFENQYYSNLTIFNISNTTIQNNYLERNNSSLYYGNGIQLQYSYDSLNISYNKIIQRQGGYGLYLYSINGSSNKTCLIGNNQISLKSNNYNYYGIYGAYLYYCDFVFNSVYNNTSYNTSSACLYLTNGENNRLLNNNFQNAGLGTVFNINNSSQIELRQSNRNNFYNGVNGLGTVYNHSINTISDLHKIQLDSNSVSVNPNFSAYDDLHAYGVDLDGNAKPYNGLALDQDKQTRSNTTPDIGSDEFRLLSLDAGISEVNQTLSGSQCLKVVLKNFGSSTLTSAKIDWKINGVSKTQYSWLGSLAKGDTDIICLGNLNFKADSLYQLKVWSSAPNAGSDSVNSNDTLITEFYPAMSGVYTIGGSSPDFSTFDSAVIALEKAGVIDSVYFKVRDGVYTEQIEINSFKGPNKKNAVIFESESKDRKKVTLQYALTDYYTNYVVSLNDAKGVSFRNITLSNTGNSYGTVVKIQNFSSYITFENNTLQGADSLSNDFYKALMVCENNSGHDIDFTGNTFYRGAYGFYFYGNSGQRDVGLIIRNNIFTEQGYSPVECAYVDNIEISNNQITNFKNNNYYGLQLGEINGECEIFNNQIILEGNNFEYGMRINEYSSNFDTLQVYNNFISISGNSNGKGLYCSYLSPAKISYNNILNQCTDSNNLSAAFYMYSGEYKLFNNNFIHTANGFALYNDYVYDIESDHNNLYSSGTKFIYWDGTDYGDLSDYQTSEGWDLNSLSINPLYSSSSNLHVNSTTLNAKGKPVAGITKDIDGETRNSTTPDIGADEFTPLANDAGVYQIISPGKNFKPDTLELEISIFNFGTDTIKQVTVQMMVNSDTISRKLINRNIPSGDTIRVKMGEYIFKADSVYDIAAWTNLPNGITDLKKSNDTLRRLDARPAMTGIYTIGGTNPDFPTFKAAIEALKNNGMVDTVTFNVRQGTYTEQLIIPPITGADHRNSIIFQSEDLDTGKVTLEFSSTLYDSNYVVFLMGADGITFRHIKLVSNSPNGYNTIINLRLKAKNNTIEHCVLEGPNTNNNSSYNSLIYSSEDADDNLWIKNNEFRAGDYSIYLSGYPNNPPYDVFENGLEITNNRFLNPSYTAIYAYYFDTVIISGNYIYMDKYTYGYTTQFQNLKRYEITHNTFDLPLGYYACYLYDCGNGSYKHRSLFANNTINSLTSSTSNYGVYMYYNYYTDFIHNTIRIENPTYTGYPIMAYSSSGNGFYNNIFANYSNGPAYYFSSSSFDKISNNDIFTTGASLVYNDGTNYSNLTDWQVSTNNDSFSFSTDPLFKSSSNLHVREVNLNGTARYFKLTPLDMDYEVRDTLKPDIGADEFNLPPNDAGISAVVVPFKPFAADTSNVKVVLKNHGGNTLYIADIYWNFNGVSQTKYAWADTLAVGDTVHVNIGVKIFNRDSAYSIKVWTSQPNGTGDSVNYNDTIEVFNQYPALSGVYTIGGASPDFNTFNDAVTALKRGGIIDSVRFDVRNGTYNEKISIPLIAGASRENSIIFQSELMDSSKVILNGTGTYAENYTIELDSANGVTFRYLSIRSDQFNLYYNNVFRILGPSKNINIHDCNLKGKPNSTSSDESIIQINNVNSILPSFDEINIYNNRFDRGAFGVYCYGYSNVGYGKNLNIYNNNFENQYYMGLYLYYTNNFTVKNNQIYHTTPQYSNGYGIRAHYCNEGYEITGNTLYNMDYYGVYLYECVGRNQDTALFANNFIHVNTNNSVYGVLNYYSSYLNFTNNNIHLTSSNSNSYTASFYSSSNTFVHNNNFVHSGAGFALYVNGSLTSCNFNNFLSNGTNLNYRNANYTTLSNWQSGTGYDSKSINVDPEYVSNTDLHVRAVDLDAKGRNIKYLINKDIDGELRDTLTPDIGADEFDIPAANDAGVLSYSSPVTPFAPGINKVVIKIKNHGSDSLKSATIHWKVNGTSQANKSWTGKLKSGQSDTVTIGTFNFGSGKKHDLVFWTTLPNGVADTTNYNDTLIKKDVYPGLKGIYTVSGTLPDYANLNEAFTALKTGGCIDTVWFKIRTGTYSYNLTLENYIGSSSKRPVYIESQSGDSTDVVLTNSGFNHIISTNGADHIRFKKITFKPNYYYAVRVENGSTGIQFENCHFNLNTNFNYYYYYYTYGIASFSDVDDSLVVRNCRFNDGIYGIYTYGYSSNTHEKGIIIEQNIFSNQIISAIYMQYSNAPKITGNQISTNASSSPIVNMLYTTGSLNLSYNKIFSTRSDGRGIYLQNHSGSTGSKGNIYNNFISVDGSSNNQEGLYFNNCSYLNIFHNSFNIYGTNSGSQPLNFNSGSNYDLRNNVITNLGGGRALYLNGNPTFAQSNYNDIFTTGSVFGYLNGTNYSNLAAWKSATGKDANSISLDPSYNSNLDLHTNLSSLDSACIPISVVTDDIDKETRNTSKADIGADEFQSLPDNLGVSLFVNPTNSCGLDSTIIKVKIFNFGNKQQYNFPVRFRVDAGNIVSATISDTLKPGKELVYQFTNKIALSLNTTYKISSWTDLSNEKFRANDTFKLVFTNYSVPDTIKSMVPADNSTNIDYPITLSWLPATGATKYDLYLWKSTDSKPTSAFVSNLTQISYQINGGLSYGETYNWQIVARNAVCSTPGETKSYTMRFLPDLIVEEVDAPSSAFSSNNITVTWKIKNVGSGASSGTWYDAIYLSGDAIYDVTDKYLGAFANPSALNASQNYSQTATVTLPNGIGGNYYVFVISDVYTNITEADNNNNSGRDTGKMRVTLTPPPDLFVTNVTRPSTAFSGSAATLSYTVKNKGTGSTRSGGWWDRYFLSTEKVINAGSHYLGANYHNGNLDVDSSYFKSLSVTIPNYISGKYFFVVETDYAHNEYEHASEGNNVTGSDTIRVILTPPPDLTVSNLVSSDTVSNFEKVNVSYNIINEGGTSTGTAFYDAVFLCPSSTFNSSISHYLTTRYHTAITSKDTSKVSLDITIPKEINGKYYLFVIADYFNSINEVSKEGNNTSTALAQIVLSPDLITKRVIVNTTDTTGSFTPIKWTVQNQGLGTDYQTGRYDSIYISKSGTWNRQNAFPVGRINYTTTLKPGDTLLRSTTVRIPDGFDGNRYFYVVTDASKLIYEHGKDTNNYKRSNLMNVALAPYPDLIPNFVKYNDSSEAGGLVSFEYKVINQGSNVAKPNWDDKIYLSKDSVFSLTRVVLLGTVARASSIEIDSSYSLTKFVTLPSSISRGDYYFFLYTDAGKTVFEHTNDSNNLIRSKRIFIDGYPPVDLRVNCPTSVLIL
jgi:hypothetical protein